MQGRAGKTTLDRSAHHAYATPQQPARILGTLWMQQQGWQQQRQQMRVQSRALLLPLLLLLAAGSAAAMHPLEGKPCEASRSSSLDSSGSSLADRPCAA